MAQPMIALYVKRISTTMNLASIILEQGSFPNVIYRFMIPIGEIESLVNPINKKVIGVKSLIDSLNFLKASK